MKNCVALLCGAVLFCNTLLLSGTGAQADEVDDLLAGKSVDVSAFDADEQQPAPAESNDFSGNAPAPLSTADSLSAGEDNDAPAWRAGVPAELGPTSVPAATTASSAPLSLVPEPSAIALAGLALLYFLVFFHRRQLA